MQPVLKENPGEWRKFALVWTVLLAGVAGWLRYRGGISTAALGTGLALLLGALAVGWGRPRWLRGPYRAVMTGSFYVGQAMGFVLLTLVFVLVVTPMGWALRLAGKDLLALRQDPRADTYWHPAPERSEFERMF